MLGTAYLDDTKQMPSYNTINVAKMVDEKIVLVRIVAYELQLELVRRRSKTKCHHKVAYTAAAERRNIKSWQIE